MKEAKARCKKKATPRARKRCLTRARRAIKNRTPRKGQDFTLDVFQGMEQQRSNHTKFGKTAYMMEPVDKNGGW
jgi:hypothetical protein